MKDADVIKESSRNAYASEDNCVKQLIKAVEKSDYDGPAVSDIAHQYIQTIRKNPNATSVESFFNEYGLGSKEGLAIMCLAEALIRIPDNITADALIHDKLKGTDFSKHLNFGKSMLINASALGLNMAERLSNLGKFSQFSDPIVREAIKFSVRYVADHFVLAQDESEAIERSQTYLKQGYLMSFDMLGEGARTKDQARHYYDQYLHLLEMMKGQEGTSISVKLSALYPRCEWAKLDEAKSALTPMINTLIAIARASNISITIDAEEAYRADFTLHILSHLLGQEGCKGYNGLGMAVQAYQKRALSTIHAIANIATMHDTIIPIRLVKGAYWDSEIKHSQVEGLPTYPVFTQKHHTDISYLACADAMLSYKDRIIPQFATHNAHTIAAIEHMAGSRSVEFQRLFGMGQKIFEHILKSHHQCRIYAPIGKHHHLLPYLLRRLIENGANNSFVNKIADPDLDSELLAEDPLATYAASHELMADQPPQINEPYAIYEDRPNSSGVDIGNQLAMDKLHTSLIAQSNIIHDAHSIVAGHKQTSSNSNRKVFSPHNQQQHLGYVYKTSRSTLQSVVDVAKTGFTHWSVRPLHERCQIVEKIAQNFEDHQEQFISLLMREAGKTLHDAISEIREAIDFCYYYSRQASYLMNQNILMDAPTGEENTLSWHPKGIFVCIAPWNFPLAIFTGQIVAALVTGNSVIAKAAEQTPIIATYAVNLMLDAGVDPKALSLILARGSRVSKHVLTDPRIAGVAFTGSTSTAQLVAQTLANRKAPVSIASLIAETGGQNAMIIDSSALLEQTIDDVVLSAFGSAGQRCSACRVVYIQSEIYEDFVSMLTGAMDCLSIGNPESFATDIGPVIDDNAKQTIEKHIRQYKKKGQLLHQSPMDETLPGSFIAPTAIEISHIADLEEEVFGPVLHIIKYDVSELDDIIDHINDYGYGLTLGIQSRIETTCEYIKNKAHVGNVYVNRSMTGAVVGVQPFGGENLSGTGFKAGGPHYLLRFMNERTYSVNISAIGGNVALFE